MPVKREFPPRTALADLPTVFRIEQLQANARQALKDVAARVGHAVAREERTAPQLGLAIVRARHHAHRGVLLLGDEAHWCTAVKHILDADERKCALARLCEQSLHTLEQPRHRAHHRRMQRGHACHHRACSNRRGWIRVHKTSHTSVEVEEKIVDKADDVIGGQEAERGSVRCNPRAWVHTVLHFTAPDEPPLRMRHRLGQRS
mmetsp:Transcript_13540/g.42540  ORF Transcript_13540/g.42540 Transcript_13540/m.42540 type:complete len:203 (+) Transcript_13540:2707-3315(+)